MTERKNTCGGTSVASGSRSNAVAHTCGVMAINGARERKIKVARGYHVNWDENADAH
jgi:hypothetical protein